MLAAKVLMLFYDAVLVYMYGELELDLTSIMIPGVHSITNELHFVHCVTTVGMSYV